MKPQPKNGKAKAKKSAKPKRRTSPLPFKFKSLDGKSYTLTAKQKLWCISYLEEDSNLTVAALEVYSITNKHLCRIPWKLLTDKEMRRRVVATNVAAQIGRDNLRSIKIESYINKVLADEGYTEKRVELRHFKNMMQSENLPASNTAIDMYYKKRDKYAPEKSEHTVKVIEITKYGKRKRKN